MKAALLCLLYWLFSIWGSTFFFPLFSQFLPNLFLLFSFLLILRWKGTETNFIAALFGLTADIFAGTPFGLNGVIFYMISFLARWLVIKVVQENTPSILFYTTVIFVFTYLLQNSLLLLLGYNYGITPVLSNFFFLRFLPSLIIVVPLYRFLSWADQTFRIRLSERKF